MPGFSEQMDSDSDDELLDTLDDNYSSTRGRYIIDINYNRPLKHFPLTLNKIEEVDETIKSPEGEKERKREGRKSAEDENGNVVSRGEVERPASASACPSVRPNNQTPETTRPHSSCGEYPSQVLSKNKSTKALKLHMGNAKNIQDRRAYSLEGLDENYLKGFSEEFVSFGIDYPSRPTSIPNSRPTSSGFTRPYHQREGSKKRSNSQPNISDPARETIREVNRFRRSLRLLGLSLSDFGVLESVSDDAGVRRCVRRRTTPTPTFSTRVLERSYSLDCVREAVRDAAHQSCPGLPQRSLLAKAAYEEWYFKKSEELVVRLKEEREKREEVKERMEEEARLRREKAGIQFQKWVHHKNKNAERATASSHTKLNEKLNGRMMKSKEEIDKAYLEWKKQKQKDLKIKKKIAEKDAEKNEREKQSKQEKKILAEKVFLEWKKKLEETIKLKEEKEREAKDKMKDKLTMRNKNSQSFQVWKQHKDNQIKVKWKKLKETAQQMEENRSIRLTERMYEAEQAFEEWLDKKDATE